MSTQKQTISSLNSVLGDAASQGLFADAEALTSEIAIARAAIAKLSHGRSDLLAYRREPKDVHHDIAIGAVFTGRGARAPDSWKLDGLLSTSAEDFLARFHRAAEELKGRSAGSILMRMLDHDADGLTARGRYAAWRRRYTSYVREHDSWLNADPAIRENGNWRKQKMTARQAELIRVTCAYSQIDPPGTLMRGEAHDWLRAEGANVSYRGVGQ